jgi:hypothetical protein
MTRRLGKSLFSDIDPVYLMDTSALSNLEERPDFEQVWTIIEALIGKGRIVVCATVFDELSNEPIMKWLLPHVTALRAGDEKSDNPDFLLHVGRITHEHPAMSRATSKKNPADPYIIALAEREGYVVVADEGTKRPSRKIPGVCHQRGIKCRTLDQFIADNSANAAGAAS